MYRRLTAPAAYVQGPGVLSEPEAFEPISGDRAVLVGGDTALARAETPLREGLSGAGTEVAAVEAGVDACTFDAIDRLAASARAAEADLVVGVGGGVALDTSKAVASEIGADLATVPTIASTDAPCSAVAVVYDDDRSFVGYVRRDRNPEVVVCDTRIVAEAPARFLRYGMGDAFATRFEAEATARSGAETPAGGPPTEAGLRFARGCFETLSRYGTGALAAAGRDAVTPAFERVVEANVLASGIGFESGGLGAAHAFHKGFSSVGADGAHGSLVGLGTVAQLVLEGDPDRLDEGLALARELSLAPTLSEVGVDGEEVDRVADRACRDDTTMSNEPMEVTPEAAADALRTADELISRGRE